MQELVLEMAYAGAFGKAERGSDYRIEPGPLLTEMHQRGYVEVSPMAAGSNLWILTQKAKSLLCQSTRLLKPTPLTRFQRDLPLDKLTTLELIGRLGDEGWDDEATPKTTKLEPFTGAVGAKKVWYHADRISKTYLKCLLRAQEVFEAGLATALHHFQLEACLVWFKCICGFLPKTHSFGVLVDMSTPLLPPFELFEVLLVHPLQRGSQIGAWAG